MEQSLKKVIVTGCNKGSKEKLIILFTSFKGIGYGIVESLCQKN